MTAPTPADQAAIEPPATLYRRWLGKFLAKQIHNESLIRDVLTAASNDAEQAILKQSHKTTWSSGVRTAQIRLAQNEAKLILRTTFRQLIPIIGSGQREEAIAAVDALNATDMKYLTEALTTVDLKSFITSQRQSAALGVAHAISRVTQSQQPLSARVYRSQALATGWVNQVINSSILRGDSAQDIAKQVKSSIRPDTPGGVSYAALRLGRTELNNAFHATAITMAQDRPWVTGMRWYTSQTHIDDPKEICTQLNGQIFDVDNVPPKPHPQCRCFVAPHIESPDVFLAHLTAGQYRDWIDQNANKAA